jgi:hypothetical protein
MSDRDLACSGRIIVIWSEDMGDRKYLTAEEVAERYRALRNWRAMRVGPAFVKIGKAILYQLTGSTLGRRKT